MRTATHTFLGAISSVIVAPFCVLGLVVDGGSSLGSISKDCWGFPLVEKGFPRILLVFLCMVILLVILDYCNLCIVAAVVMVQLMIKMK
jgi:hypothetical protein